MNALACCMTGLSASFQCQLDLDAAERWSSVVTDPRRPVLAYPLPDRPPAHAVPARSRARTPRDRGRAPPSGGRQGRLASKRPQPAIGLGTPAMRSAFHIIAEAADTTGLPRSRSTTVPTCRAVSPAHENSITSSSPSRRAAHSNRHGNALPRRDRCSVSHRRRLVAELRADPMLAARYLRAAAEDADARVLQSALSTLAVAVRALR